MSKRTDLGKRVSRIVAGAGVLFNLGSAPKPPDLDAAVNAQQLQAQWADNEKSNVLPQRRVQARELGYQLKEPAAGERRGAPDSRDSHDRTLSSQPARVMDSDGLGRDGRTK